MTVTVRHEGDWDLPGDLPFAGGYGSDSRWLTVLRDGLRQRPLRIEATCDGRFVGALPLALVESRLFGRFLVSLPYVNTAGVTVERVESLELRVESDQLKAKQNRLSDSDSDSQLSTLNSQLIAVQPRPPVADALIDRAVQIADEFHVRYLELRHEARIEHPALTFERTDKVHMRLELPDNVDALRAGLKAGVRNQVKKGESHDLDIRWGRDDVLPDFYRVFSRNMRDLGTPVYGKRLFAAIMRSFGRDAEFCVVTQNARPIAAALLIHADGVTQVPSASSLRAFNHLNANMLLYFHLLSRAIERGSRVFDFGRSSEGSGTYRFKKQWGATPFPSVWQYYVREGDANAMRPESARNQRLIRLWKRLPVWVANVLGPWIVRGIP